MIFNLFNSKDQTNQKIIIFIAVLFCLSSINYISVLDNYMKNKIIYNQNINRISLFQKQYQANPNIKNLYLLPPQNEAYGFGSLAGVDWIENSVKHFFGLDTSVKLFLED